MTPPGYTGTYRFAMRACTPWVRWWGRLEVSGLDALPPAGPVLLVGNHDSNTDPVAVGVAALHRRQIHALAKSSLWKIPGLGPILNGMGQVPIERGAGDAHALDSAIGALRGGMCIGVFPEGTISRGWTLRPRSGTGRLALAVPEAQLVCVAVTGTVDFVRFPKRPRVSVEFFKPAGGQPRPGEEAAAISARLVEEIRAKAPIIAGGRRRTNAKWLAEGERRDAEARSAQAGSQDQT